MNVTKNNGGDYMAFGPELVWAWSRYIQKFTGKKVQKVEGAGERVLLTLSGSSHLLLSWGAQSCGAVFVSAHEKKALLAPPSTVPPITNALKSHLNGAELISCEQVRRDKILKLSFRKSVGAGFALERVLIFEIMERYSNLILLDEEGLVVETAKHIHPADNSYRSVLPGHAYVPPPAFEGLALEAWLLNPSPETVLQISGLGAPLLRALAKLDAAEAAKYLSNFYGMTPLDSFTTQKLGKYVTIFPVLLDGAEAIAERPEDSGRITTLQPLSFTNIDVRRKRVEDKIKREVKRREKQISDIEKLLAQDPEALRIKAEAIISNLWQIKPGSKEVSLRTWGDDGKIREEVVTLDPARTPQQNAASLFAKYKKISASQKRAAALLEKVREELAEEREQLEFASLIDDPASLFLIEQELGITKENRAGKKKKSTVDLPPHKRFDIAFALVFVGMSAKGNRYVTFQASDPDDFWFHVQGIPGAHVILRFSVDPDEKQLEEAIEFCASLAAWYSKARAGAKVRVDFTKRKYVSPIKGGIANVTYKDFQSLSVDPTYWKAFLSESE